jgi:hypothetical protein
LYISIPRSYNKPLLAKAFCALAAAVSPFRIRYTVVPDIKLAEETSAAMHCRNRRRTSGLQRHAVGTRLFVHTIQYICYREKIKAWFGALR